MIFIHADSALLETFSLMTSPPSSPLEQKQKKHCFLVRIHDSTTVENCWSGKQPTARAVGVRRSDVYCSNSPVRPLYSSPRGCGFKQ
ncbi:unnamed protein product [Pieris brassicae]|uniref:Uncharacterized protein n=1 Tax=Pieris brassicae TaxID=7116 RepID=A0A9P0T6U9_PIEBR|nr:unnamed protein product [Pieris brassicae]